MIDAQLKARNELKLKDLKAKNYLYQEINRVILETILKKDTAKYIWDFLKKKYQGTSRVTCAQLQALRKEFEILHMKVGESVDEYFARTLTIANQIRIHGEKMEDVTIIEKIIRSMTSKFDYVVCSIEESNEIDTMSVDKLQSSLLVHELCMSNHIEEKKALKVTHTGNLSGRSECRGSFRGRGRGRGRGHGTRERSFCRSSIECYNCHKIGHFQWECPGKIEEKENFVETDEEEILLMAYTKKEQAENEEIWYLDFGCSNHMTGNKNLFYDLNESSRQSVKLSNNSSMSFMGKGTVKVHMNRKMQNINDVYYVPELKRNLINLGQLQEIGYAIVIHKDTCQNHDPKEGIIVAFKMCGNRMFELKSETFKD